MMDLTQKQWVKHSVFHPFEGFEDLRWKKGGSVLYASIVILLWFVAEILHTNALGYQFAMTTTKMFSIVPYIVQTIALMLKNLSTLLSQQLFNNADVSPREQIVWMEAGCLISILPILIMYVFLQKYFTEGIERSGLVG
ncbi:hypothetical protein [uncultured Ruminococcus sp.]|uniref:hypothetical protein n=1 Tax=uncultured Ruminococcus sp. TaxID=165186 RepID=UPI0025F105E6|nr:hypothetical protein [uncultured Ruminococcus sp.]